MGLADSYRRDFPVLRDELFLTVNHPLPERRKQTRVIARADENLAGSAHGTDVLAIRARARISASLEHRPLACVMVVVAVLIVWAAQLWIITAGQMVHFPEYTHAYGARAEALVHGLPGEMPLSGKLRLERVIREGSPVPTLLMAPFALWRPGAVGDQFLVFAFVIATTALCAAWIYRLWLRRFSEVPAWTLLLGIGVVGLATPIPLLLSHAASEEAAIATGQFFLLGGLYIAWSCWQATMHVIVARLALVSACWAVALGCDPSLFCAAGALLVLVAWRVFRTSAWRKLFPRLAALALPLAIVILLFSQLRAASNDQLRRPTASRESGWNSSVILAESRAALFGAYNYFLHPLTRNDESPPMVGVLLANPFLWLALVPALRLLVAGRTRRRKLDEMLETRLKNRVAAREAAPSEPLLPAELLVISDDKPDLSSPAPVRISLHRSSPVPAEPTGETTAAPAVGPRITLRQTGAVPAIAALEAPTVTTRIAPATKPTPPAPPRVFKDLRWLMVSLGCAAFFGLAPTALFGPQAARFLANFTPAMTLLAMAGVFRRDQELKRRPEAQRKALVGSCVLALASVAAGIALAFADGHFRRYNPELLSSFDQLLSDRSGR